MSEAAIDDLEVTIRFGLGTSSTSLGELASIQPGFVFETDALAERPVTIEVNGAVVGRGDLVQVGDRLGVRVKEVSDHGPS